MPIQMKRMMPVRMESSAIQFSKMKLIMWVVPFWFQLVLVRRVMMCSSVRVPWLISSWVSSACVVACWVRMFRDSLMASWYTSSTDVPMLWMVWRMVAMGCARSKSESDPLR